MNAIYKSTCFCQSSLRLICPLLSTLSLSAGVTQKTVTSATRSEEPVTVSNAPSEHTHSFCPSFLLTIDLFVIHSQCSPHILSRPLILTLSMAFERCLDTLIPCFLKRIHTHTHLPTQTPSHTHTHTVTLKLTLAWVKRT